MPRINEERRGASLKDMAVAIIINRSDMEKDNAKQQSDNCMQIYFQSFNSPLMAPVSHR